MVAPNRCLVGYLKGFFQAATVHVKTIPFPRQGGYRSNGTSGFTRQLGRLLVCLLVVLVLHNYHALHTNKNLTIKITFEVALTSRMYPESMTNGVQASA